MASEATDSNDEGLSPAPSVLSSSPEHVPSVTPSANSSFSEAPIIAAEPLQVREPETRDGEGCTHYVPQIAPHREETSQSEVGTTGRLDVVEVGSPRPGKKARRESKAKKRALYALQSKAEAFEEAGECSFDDFSFEEGPPPIPRLGLRVRPTSRTRVSDEEKGGARSKLTPADLVRIAHRYPWPAGTSLSLPDHQARPIMDFDGHMVMFEGAVEHGGLRLPLPSFYTEFLNDVGLAP